MLAKSSVYGLGNACYMIHSNSLCEVSSDIVFFFRLSIRLCSVAPLFISSSPSAITVVTKELVTRKAPGSRETAAVCFLICPFYVEIASLCLLLSIVVLEKQNNGFPALQWLP